MSRLPFLATAPLPRLGVALAMFAACFAVLMAQNQALTSLAEVPPTLATVIFYAEGGLWKGSAVQILTLGAAKSDAASMAFMFDGAREFGFLLPRRFIALTVDPGEHTFSASQTKKRADTHEPLVLKAEAGKVYYIRLTATTGSLKPLVSGTQGHLRQVTCPEFAADAEHDRLRTIENRRVAPTLLNRIVALKDIPPCG